MNCSRIVFLLFVSLVLSAAFASAASFTHMATLNGTEGEGDWALFNGPTGVFVDSSNRVYVTDSDNYRVKIYSQNLSYLSIRGGELSNEVGGLNNPKNCWVAGDGKLYIADTFNNRIAVYTAYNGVHSSSIGSGSGLAYQLQRPYAVAVSPDGSVHVADTMSNRVQVYDSSYLYVKSIQDIEMIGDHVFNEPKGIFIDQSSGMVYLADTGNNRIQVFDANYSFVERLGWGTGENEFNLPHAVWVDSLKRIYVADTYNNRVQVFDSDYSFIGSISGMHDGEAITEPRGVAVDSLGRVFVADTGNNRVLVFQMVDEELEASFARAKIDDAVYVADQALAKLTEARFKASQINSSGCLGAPQAFVYLSKAEDDYALAVSSINSAEDAYGSGEYENSSEHAGAAKLFAEEVKKNAQYSLDESNEFLEGAGDAIYQLNEAQESFDRIDSINSTASNLNLSLSIPSQYETAVENLESAQEYCAQGDFSSSMQHSEYCIGNVTLALDSMRQRINLELIPKYSELEDEFELLKGNITYYDLPIDVTPIEIELELTNTLILDSKYEEALVKMGELSDDISGLRDAVESYTVDVEGEKAAVQDEIYSAEDRLDSVKDEAANYSQNIDTRYATSLIRQASSNLTGNNIEAANQSIINAHQEIDLLNSSLQQTISQINSAQSSISEAEKEVSAAESMSIPFLAADLEEAKAKLLEAKAKVYTSPVEAQSLAEEALAKAESEKERLKSQGPLLVMAAIGVVAVIFLAFLAGTGVLAGVFAFKKMKRKKKPAKKKKKVEQNEK